MVSFLLGCVRRCGILGQVVPSARFLAAVHDLLWVCRCEGRRQDEDPDDQCINFDLCFCLLRDPPAHHLLNQLLWFLVFVRHLVPEEFDVRRVEGTVLVRARDGQRAVHHGVGHGLFVRNSLHKDVEVALGPETLLVLLLRPAPVYGCLPCGYCVFVCFGVF